MTLQIGDTVNYYYGPFNWRNRYGGIVRDVHADEDYPEACIDFGDGNLYWYALDDLREPDEDAEFEALPHWARRVHIAEWRADMEED